MTDDDLSRRRFVSLSAWLVSMLSLPACGGGGSGGDASPPAPPPPPPPPPSPPPAGTVFTSLAVQAGSLAGTLPYTATILPTEGQAPEGTILQSPDDGAMQCSILSTWPDRSAAVVVVSGMVTVTAGQATSLRIQAATATAATKLTAARIASLVTQVSVDFGSLGTASVSGFASPERVWWANSQTICARYRAQASGHATLEAVVDIHAFADNRALVEVVVENAKFDARNSTTSSVPAPASYTTATLKVNGSDVANVSGTGGAGGTHRGMRAWYARAWVGGDPKLRVTQLHTDLQKHPLLFKCDSTSSADMSAYASDTYAPWGTGRHRASNMGGTGDHPSIGGIPLWEAHALQSGDARAWAATEASSLAMLSYNINSRDVSGVVPHSAIMPLKCQGSFWRNWPSDSLEPAFEVAHQPASGLMAFIGRPSPVFIEIAQKIAVWTGTIDSTRDLLNNFNEAAVGITDSTGIVGNTQVRAKAWGPRSIGHAAWLSPSDHPWRASGVEWLDRNARYLTSYATNARAVLLPLYEGEPDAPEDVDRGIGGYQVSTWMYHFVVAEWHKLAASKLLSELSSARQAAIASVADQLATAVVKWVIEQPNGGWRFLPYRTRLGDLSSNVTVNATWTAQRSFDLSGAPSSITGRWGGGIGNETSWSQAEAAGFVNVSGANYPSNFWAALVAAVERGVPNAAQAWTTVQQGITNLSSWRAGFSVDPRWGAYPRNV